MNGMPKENAVIYLNVPINTIFRLISKKGKRSYLNGKKRDIEEDNKSYLSSVENMFQSLAKNNPNWHLINCAPHGKLLPINTISKQVIEIVKKILDT
jgi:thymidylate kinase